MFIDLGRRFQDLGPTYRAEPELLAALNNLELGSSLGWAELLEHPRVVLLAEAGSGKTEEMRAQVKRLNGEGKAAWFLPLESLAKEPVERLLSPSSVAALNRWKLDDETRGWFMLDSVDELKLADGRFDLAVARLAATLEGHFGRAHVVVSCRPTDWRPELDLRTFEELLAVPLSPIKVPDANEAFLAALRREDGKIPQGKNSLTVISAQETTRIVTLLPMGDAQIEAFATASGVSDPLVFIAEIERQDAWTFARRPLDLTELIEVWRVRGRLGTRLEQHEADITAKLRDDPDRQDRGVLSDAKARLGAESLALALALTRTRAIRSPDKSAIGAWAEGALDAESVLVKWTPAERQSLLRRAMFDPATYGRVRFHHRSVQEYLAARRVLHLISMGMSRKTKLHLFFSDIYGMAVVIPSMRPIAVWLALWDADVRTELERREPEALLGGGDPQSLSLEARTSLLRAFVGRYGEGGYRGVSPSLENVRRLAGAELAPVVRDLWGTGPSNEDVRELLLEVMWTGALKSCTDLALDAAQRTDWNDRHRVLAVKALLACGRIDLVHPMALEVVAASSSWTEGMVRSLVTDLFPDMLSVRDLLALVERAGKDQHVDGFGWIMLQVAEMLDPGKTETARLRDGLADFVERGHTFKVREHRFESDFAHLTPALATICLRQLRLGASDARLLACCTIAARFGTDESGARDPVKAISDAVRADNGLKEAIFWEDLALLIRIGIGQISPAQQIFMAGDGGLAGSPGVADRSWLLAALDQTATPNRRAVALGALIDMWIGQGRPSGDFKVMREAVRDEPGLAHHLDVAAQMPMRNERVERLTRERLARERSSKRKEAQRITEWRSWRKKLVANPATGFSEAEQENTLCNLHFWLASRAGSRSRLAVWDGPALAQAFGAEVEWLASKALREIWRANTPTIPSERAAREQSGVGVPRLWVLGLCGLQGESATPGWATRLSEEEAAHAAAYTMVESNGLAAFCGDLADARPAVLEAVLGRELEMQLSAGNAQAYSPMTQDLRQAAPTVKRLLVPRLVAALERQPATGLEAYPGHAQHLDNMLHIVIEVATGKHRLAAAEICARNCADGIGPVRIWLRALFALDFPAAARATVARLNVERPGSHKALEVVADLFGDRELTSFEAEPPVKAELLKSLVHATYRAAPPAGDRNRRGVYTPDASDRAARGRNFLLSALLDTPGPEAVAMVLALAAEPEFAHFADRMRLFARRRAAEDSEFQAFLPDDIFILDSMHELPPADRDGLFRVMVDRLEELQHELKHGDFSDRRTLRTVSDEAEMQRTLASRLRHAANGIYLVTREDEVVDAKLPDIRIHAVRGVQKAVCEVKLANKRVTVGDLERALKAQLVGQYLRHEDCRAGCLLLVWNGIKKLWLRPRDRAPMTFAELVEYLGKQASDIEAEQGYRIRLAVVGLDLTDPYLAPAHGRQIGIIKPTLD